jgi:hypothetical protein
MASIQICELNIDYFKVLDVREISEIIGGGVIRRSLRLINRRSTSVNTRTGSEQSAIFELAAIDLGSNNRASISESISNNVD